MQTPDKKLKRKFNRHIKKYQNWCIKHGYNSKDEIVLLWYFNRKGKAIKKKISNGNEYYIIYQDNNYKISLLITIFKNGEKTK